MVMVRVDFETIDRGHGIFKCPSELHLDVSYQHIIHSTVRIWLIDSQPESEEKQRLLSTIETKLSIEYTLAQLRQETEDNEVAMGVLQSSDPTMGESNENPRLMPITDRQGINDEFHQAFQKIYSKQDVEDSSEAVQEFHDSGGDTRPLEYLKSKALTNEESESIEGEITLTELNHVLINKMKRSSAPGIDGFTVNWLRKF